MERRQNVGDDWLDEVNLYNGGDGEEEKKMLGTAMKMKRWWWWWWLWFRAADSFILDC